MKVFTVLSTILAALAVGAGCSPIANPAPAAVTHLETSLDLVTRAGPAAVPATKPDIKKPSYNAAVAAATAKGAKLVTGKFYVFTLEWDLPAVAPGAETKDELAKLQQKLGFKHVAVVVGQVKETKTGRGKNEQITFDFDGQFMDLIKEKDLSAKLRSPTNWAPVDKQTLRYLKETTSKKAGNLKKLGQAYFDDPKHKKYAVDGNNCATFKDAIIADL